ncbi:hypothetical protein ACFXK0_14915 [Nocardia sp. NPDC059177]|uniref:hypothetical protein n=1 Tax=Nocardia sp. NPDC059177 TaxID=3346759 RepID=UPI0036A1E68B
MATTKKPDKVVTKKASALTSRTRRRTLLSPVTTIKPRSATAFTLSAPSVERGKADTTRKKAPPKTEVPAEKAEDSGLDGLDPKTTPARDAKHFRRIIEAREQLARAEAELRAAVKEAHAAGDSWTVIGLALDTSRQAAFQRFGKD